MIVHQPIRSPWYTDLRPWPYILGPNYTRPVFRENTRQGNFVAQPTIKMSLRGLGQDDANTCWLSEQFRNCYAQAEADVRGSTLAWLKCDNPVSDAEEAECYNGLIADRMLEKGCLQYCYAQAEPGSDTVEPVKTEPPPALKKLPAPGSAAAAQGAASPWYKNPLYIGAIALAAVFLMKKAKT